MSNFRKFLKNDNGNGLATLTDDELLNEVVRREQHNPFPLHVFNEKIKPYLSAINKYYDLPGSYLGLSLLSAYSTAIGTGYHVLTGPDDYIFLPVWSCLVGISSSGGSTATNKIYGPLNKMQDEYDRQWDDKTKGMSKEQREQETIETVLARDIHLATLVRSVLPDNPKGMCKVHDELLEWINGMNQLSNKEGTDEQFWVSSWNCFPYSGIRSGKQKFVIPRPFVNVFGKMQYAILPKLFAKDRDTTGFIFRMLFALPEVNKVSDKLTGFSIPVEWTELHRDSLMRLHKDIQVVNPLTDSKSCIVSPAAEKPFKVWRDAKLRTINQIPDLHEMSIQAGIYGKIKEYIYRFSAILHLADRTFDPKYNDLYPPFKREEIISEETMLKALELGEYFFNSASEVYALVKKELVAPPEVLTTAYMLKRGKSASSIAEVLYGSREPKFKVKVQRQIKAWTQQYARVFGSNNF